MVVMPVRITPKTKLDLEELAPNHNLTSSQLARSLINDGIRRLRAGMPTHQPKKDT